MTTAILAPHKINKQSDHYKQVLAAMRQLGSPAIRAIWHGAYGWLAIEGSHRIAAARELGLPVAIVDVAGETTIEHDLQDIESPCSAEALEAFLVEGIDQSVEYNLEVSSGTA
jgi:hypothetical protein